MIQAPGSSALARIAVLALTSVILFPTDALPKPNKPTTFNVLPINITSVTPQGGQLIANGTIGSAASTID